jgi:starch synthase
LVRARIAASGVTVYAVRSSALYERPGGLYADAHGVAWADNHRRFIPLAWAAKALAAGADPHWAPGVVHAHDWHAGMVPAMLAAAESPVPCVTTIHNLAFQGLFPAQSLIDLGLPRRFFALEGVEFWGQVSFLKAGVQYADAVTTVSPSYAREILQPEMGCGLDGALRNLPSGPVRGILNGVDTSVWNPATDPHISPHYDITQRQRKGLHKAALREALGLPASDGPLLAVISRLTQQKGLDVLLDALEANTEHVLPEGTQCVVLGQGDAVLEAGYAALARRLPTRVAMCAVHDEALAHRLYAAADAVLVPSRFEPCGLTQLYAMAYGALPVVHAVGGLADTVVDCSLEHLDDDTATGIAFSPLSVRTVTDALRRIQALWRRPERWAQVQQRGMEQSFTWAQAAQAYAGVYAEVIERRAGRRYTAAHV